MNNFFATPEGAWGDGSVHLTITGIVIVVVIIALLLIVAAFVRQKNASRKAALDYQTACLLCGCHCTCRGMFHDQTV